MAYQQRVELGKDANSTREALVDGVAGIGEQYGALRLTQNSEAHLQGSMSTTGHQHILSRNLR